MRHGEIEDRDVGMDAFGQLDRLATVAGFGDDFKPVAFQEGPNALPENHMIISQEDAQGCCLRGGAGSARLAGTCSMVLRTRRSSGDGHPGIPSSPAVLHFPYNHRTGGYGGC